MWKEHACHSLFRARWPSSPAVHGGSARPTARSLADSGADVAITYLSSAGKAAEVVKELESRGVHAAAFQMDQADTAQAPRLIDDVVTRFGGLDILVNNAAVSVEQGRTIDDPDVDVTALDRMHATNYTGVIAIIRAAAKVIRDNGRIVNVGSGIGSRVGRPGFADYAATRPALSATPRAPPATWRRAASRSTWCRPG